MFGYFVALPAAVHFLTNYDSEHYNIQIRAKDYYSFVMLVLVGGRRRVRAADLRARRSSGSAS